MSNRTSNKQILDAIEAQTQAINSLVGALGGAQNTSVPGQIDLTPVTDPEPKAKPSKVKVSEAYFNAMLPKWQALANSKGTTYVGYAYRKSNGRVGLWAVPKDKLAAKAATDSYIGNVAEVHPS